MTPTLEFGLGVTTTPGLDHDPLAEAALAEDVGFDFVSASDHLHGDTGTYEPWTLLTWIAAVTTRIKVLTRVLAVPYRPPPVMAKMSETLDRLSSGRLILGLGGGYLDEEFRAFGLPVRSQGDRITGMEEAIEIARGLWSEETFSFDGRIYRTEDARIEPRPSHRIPIWLGTYGPRALAVTGRLADGWIPSLGFAPPEKVVLLRDRMEAAAREAGRDPGEVARIYNIAVRVDRDADPDASIVSGPPDMIAERLLSFVELGFTGFNFIVSGADRRDQIERLGREVIPAVRAAR
jgi:probable F420-dependent oxidoreductase